MRSASIFPCIMKMISNFTIFLSFKYLFSNLFFKNITGFYSCCSFVNNFIFFFLKVIIACSLKNSQNFFMQSLTLYTSCLFSMLLNEDILDIAKHDGKCLLTFVVDEFSGLFLHPSMFSVTHSYLPK